MVSEVNNNNQILNGCLSSLQEKARSDDKLKEWDVFGHFFQRLAEYPAWKFIAGFLIGVLRVMYGSFRPAYGTVMCLWLTDTATGFYHARANPAVIPESRRMYHGLVKLMIYYLLLFLGHQCGQVALTAFLQGIIEGAIMLTEGYSILENIDKICKLKKINIPIIQKILGVTQDKLEDIGGKHEDN